MNIAKSRILRAITLIICLLPLWTDDALAAEKRGYRKRPVKVARNSQTRATPNRLNAAIVYRQLAKTVDLSALKFHTPFSQAIDILRNSTVPALNIIVLWRDLSENATVERDTPIYMDGLSGIPLRTGLELLLRAVSSGPEELGYVIEGGAIIIATKSSLPVKMVTRVYDIRDLVAEPANYRFGMPVGPFGFGTAGFGGGGMGQMPVSGFGGGFGAYGGASREYTSGPAMQYNQGRRDQRANGVADLITGSIAPGKWR